MPWPPVVPPTNRTNATVQLDNHPADHNQMAQAVTDLTTRLTSAAWGIIPAGLAAVTADVAITATATPGTPITGASCAVTTLAGRRYRVVWTCNAWMTNNSSSAIFVLRRDGTIIQQRGFQCPLGGYNVPAAVELIDAPAAGAHTYTVAAWINLGGGTLHAGGSAAEVAQLTVTDVGPTAPTTLEVVS